MTKSTVKKKEEAVTIEPLYKSKTTADKLFISQNNVRKVIKLDEAKDAEMDGSILSCGLINGLCVEEEIVDGKHTGRFGVIAGGRRFASILRLRSQSKINQNFEVDIAVYDSKDAVAVSLLENSTQQKMEPYDDFLAYESLIKQGSTVDSIARVHGVTTNYVRGRLRLANASPKIMELFKSGELDIEQLMALCLTDNHKAQESAWFNTHPWEKDPYSIRRNITNGELDASDKLVKYVGLEAYKESGGEMRQDFFQSEDTILDAPLLHKLVDEKLAQDADDIAKEGWGWTEFMRERDFSYIHSFGTAEPVVKKKLSKVESKERNALVDSLKVAEEQLEASEYAIETEEYASLEKAVEEAKSALAGFQENLKSWGEEKSKLGVLIYVGENGKLQRNEGLIKGEAEEEKEAKEEKVEPKKKAYPQTLVDSLNATRTVAMQVEVSKNTKVALALLAEKMIFSIMPKFNCPYHGAVTTTFNHADMDRLIPNYDETSLAHKKYDIFERWHETIPNERNEVFDWLYSMEQEALLEVMAFFTSISIDFSHTGRDEDYQKLAKLVKLDIADYYTPSFDDFYKKLPVDELVKVAKSNKCDIGDNVEKMTRKQVATNLADLMKESKWVPPQLEVNQ